MKQNTTLSNYVSLPPFLRRAFTQGSFSLHGRLDALNMSFAFMSASQNGHNTYERRNLCAELLFFAFEIMPLDRDFACQILKAQKVLPNISSESLAIPTSAADFWHEPPAGSDISVLIKNGETQALMPIIENGIHENSDNLYWLRQALETTLLGADISWLENIANGVIKKSQSSSRDIPAALVALQCWFKGTALWLAGKYELSLQSFDSSPLKWPGLWEMIGHCLCRLGEKDKALAIWSKIVEARPWHVSLLTTMCNRALGHDRPLPVVPGSTAVLLYSWNKAEDLDATLASLAASARDIAKIVCLDNGSTDSTPEVMAKWAEHLGRDLFIEVKLPVNIGAAAARNWLAAMPEVRACEYAAYLDDDALVPADWLRHLFRAVDLYPNSSSYGLRVVDAQYPFIVQSGPLHITPLFTPIAGQAPLPGQPTEGEDAEAAFSAYKAYGEPFKVSAAQGMGLEQADMGQFDFVGPCISTTGCCHMFKTADLADSGGFALSLSPSQYDDLEFDLRAASRGRLSCHTGFCSARHFKRTGGGAQMKGPSFGNALGNKYKLHGLYNAEEISAMARMEEDALNDDLLRLLSSGALIDNG